MNAPEPHEDETTPEAAQDHLLLFRNEAPLSEARARAALDVIGDRLVGHAPDVQSAWVGAEVGTATVRGVSLDELRSHFEAIDLVPVPGGLCRVEGVVEWVGDAPPMLPAPPLVLTRPLPVSRGVHVRFEFERALDEAEAQMALEIFSVFLVAYAFEEHEGAELARCEGTQAEVSITDLQQPPDELVRGHAYWMVEILSRFLPVRSASFVGEVRRGRGRGLRPSWIGPAIVIVGALASSRLLEGPGAVRAAALCWIFGPLVFTFLSRQHVGKWTWGAAVLNALVQGVVAVLLERPDFLAPNADVTFGAHMAELEARFEMLLYGSRLFGLVWAIPYMLSKNRRV